MSLLPPSDDEQALARLGYAQELHRALGAFSNFALSLSIICILAGCITSFHVGLCTVGGAAIGLGWPICCLFSLVAALTMAQIASAYPTAGGLYHWASLLGGRGWGWLTAWFNLAGLITVLAAINVGTYEFAVSALAKPAGFDPGVLGEGKILVQLAAVLGISVAQAVINHRGIRLTSRLTDFSGWWILLIATLLTVVVLAYTPNWDLSRLIHFDNFSGLPDADTAVWPESASVVYLFFLGMLLPAYTVTGFDASAHASEETVLAAERVPRGIVRSVVVSGIFGWVMLCAMVLAAPDLREAARQGGDAFTWILRQRLPEALTWPLLAAIVLAQLLCGLATVTSASRMLYAFARDGGVPFSRRLRHVNPTWRTPIAAIWTVALASVAFTVWTPVYSTITAVCALLLYVSYVIPTALGFVVWGRRWKAMGPWSLGVAYLPLALLAIVGCWGLFLIGIQPPNQKAFVTLVAFGVGLAVLWGTIEKRRFQGPPSPLR